MQSAQLPRVVRRSIVSQHAPIHCNSYALVAILPAHNSGSQDLRGLAQSQQRRSRQLLPQHQHRQSLTCLPWTFGWAASFKWMTTLKLTSKPTTCCLSHCVPATACPGSTTHVCSQIQEWSLSRDIFGIWPY